MPGWEYNSDILSSYPFIHQIQLRVKENGTFAVITRVVLTCATINGIFYALGGSKSTSARQTILPDRSVKNGAWVDALLKKARKICLLEPASGANFAKFWEKLLSPLTVPGCLFLKNYFNFFLPGLVIFHAKLRGIFSIFSCRDVLFRITKWHIVGYYGFH